MSDGIDPELIRRAEPHFIVAFATYRTPGIHPYDVARTIAQEAAIAGFTKPERRRLLEHLFAFADGWLSRRIDPLLLGEAAAEPTSLFSGARLGGLFRSSAIGPPVEDLIETRSEQVEERERALIEQLISATRLYETSEGVRQLLEFTARLRGFAPFNAMLLHIQKPGLTHAATAADWYLRFRRRPKRDARPLMVLRTMGPVDFVFDVLDTEGRDLPPDAFTFPTLGALSEACLEEIIRSIVRDGIGVTMFDAGDAKAGSIRLVARSPTARGKHTYEMRVNRNHPPATRLVTVAHELAHLHLGHLGADGGRRIGDRRDRSHAQHEVEAEIVAYLVARRNGLTPKSESYLSSYRGAFDDIDLFSVMRVANAVERVMGISAQQLWAAKALSS